ncbi:MAG: DNA repair protein RecO [Pseudomonadota bacterium]
MSRVLLQPTFILHHRAYRDSSLLLDTFSAQHGRIDLVARGVRKQGRHGSRAALLQPFVPLLVSFSGRSELKTLVAAEPAAEAMNLTGERLYSGLYLNELLVRLLHRHDPHPRLFAAYAEALQGLECVPGVDLVLRRFELRLLEELGYSFDFGCDSYHGIPVSAGEYYRYEAEYGLVQSDRDGPGQRYPGAALLQLAAGDFEGDARRVAKYLFREALAVQLGPEPLRSRELFARRYRSEPTRGGTSVKDSSTQADTRGDASSI